jgi:hypothetical protein
VPTECNPTLFEFSPVDGRRVVAAFASRPVMIPRICASCWGLA